MYFDQLIRCSYKEEVLSIICLVRVLINYFKFHTIQCWRLRTNGRYDCLLMKSLPPLSIYVHVYVNTYSYYLLITNKLNYPQMQELSVQDFEFQLQVI